MSFQLFLWAYGLPGLTPVAKLLAMRACDSADESGVAVIKIRDTLDWLGAEYDETLNALAELCPHGFSWQDDGCGGFRVVIKAIEKPPAPVALTRPNRRELAVYVISSGSVCKIGISIDPDSRVHGLQQGSPSIPLVVRFAGWGPGKEIRQVERSSHERLAEVALGREWFATDAETCIEVVKQELAKVGVIVE